MQEAKKKRSKLVTYIQRRRLIIVHTFAFINILDWFTRQTKTSAINTISPKIRDNGMHWLIFFLSPPPWVVYVFLVQEMLYYEEYPFLSETSTKNNLNSWFVKERATFYFYANTTFNVYCETAKAIRFS